MGGRDVVKGNIRVNPMVWAVLAGVGTLIAGIQALTAIQQVLAPGLLVQLAEAVKPGLRLEYIVSALFWSGATVGLGLLAYHNFQKTRRRGWGPPPSRDRWQ